VKGGNFRGEHFSPLSQVTDENVENLGLAWATDLPIPDGISATPIVVDGVIYLSGAFSVVYAIDATDGHIIWSFDPRVRDALAGLWPGRQESIAALPCGTAWCSPPPPTAG
jgi:quinohemoprotein ethanol dehydrogenase